MKKEKTRLKEISSISELFLKKEIFKDKIIKISGWVKNIRISSRVIFLVIKDGFSESAQIVYHLIDKNKIDLEKIKKINEGTFLSVIGKLILTPDKKEQPFEISAIFVTNIKYSQNNPLLQNKRIPLETIRSHLNLRSKTNHFLSTCRIRNSIYYAINIFFEKKSFIYVNTPIITSNDTEGAGENFFLRTKEEESFWNKEDFFLTVSSQLHLESLVQGFGNIYTLSPCFRAENSNTNRHLSEFWMLEAEMHSISLKKMLFFIENLIKEVLNYVLINNEKEIIFFEVYYEQKIKDKLLSYISKKFKIISYSKAIHILKERKIFDIEWGDELTSDQEKYLCKKINSPIFIIKYPKKIKPFYMKESNNLSNSKKKTVECVDLIFPEIGELLGGSVREDDYLSLNKNINTNNLKNKLDWYLELREKGGYSITSGFGLGIERLIMIITSIKNIRDVITFPISSNQKII